MPANLTTDTPPRRGLRAPALSREARRSMIIEAALPLLIEHGEMVTTRQIADAAGIAEGTIFRAFDDKDDLIATVIDAALDPTPLEYALAAIDRSLPFRGAVEAAIELAQRRTVEVWRLASSVGPRFHDRVRRPMVDSSALINLFEPHRDQLGVAPDAAARLLRSFTFAMTHPSFVDEPATPSHIADVLLHGVLGSDASC